ncbi:MAG: cob(I)yrinic acid a,c-diamide adenosyltransferase [Phycisphaerae bacterium]|nr:cob(I)yrinic acid a,c-diamide adenosyltransferase [Phycisphaerae bacterium]
MKLYTGGGDHGRTGLFGGRRVAKDHDQVAACGDVDELNAAIGLAAVACTDAALAEPLRAVQRDLFLIGAALACESDMPVTARIDSAAAARLEHWIDAADAEAGPLRNFILPGGCEPAARLHVARTVCRRAERSVVRAAHGGTVDPGILVYLNRLGDWLFALARVANRRAGIEDSLWSGRTGGRETPES